MSDPLNQELIREAADKARAGDREAARELLETVLEQDDQDVNAWLLLARLTTNIDEKRLALETILQIDPDNEKARQLLERLDGGDGKRKNEEQLIVGVPQQQLRLIVLGIAGTLLVALVLLIVVLSGRSNEAAEQEQQLTQIAAEQTGIVVTRQALETQDAQFALDQTATQEAAVSPTPTVTPTSSQPTLPPTFTPTPTIDPRPPTALPPPAINQGALVGTRGRDLQSLEALPVYLYPFGGQPIQVTGEEGRNPDVSPDAQQIVYARLQDNRVDVDVTLIDRSGQDVLSVLANGASVGNYLESSTPRFSASGNRVVFIGDSLDSLSNEVYVAILEGELIDGLSMVRITNDDANYAYPALSPDGNRIVVVRTVPGGGSDLVIINIADRTQTALTTDDRAFAETMPHWSPDGRQIVYAAAPSDNPRSHDIYVISPDAPGSARRLIQNESDDIHPVFSPDSRFIAFSSDRANSYEIFVYNLTTQELFQVTDDLEDDFVTGWSPGF